MSRLRAILLRDGHSLALALQLFLMLRGYQLRDFARQLRRFEWDVRTWLAEIAIARLKTEPLKPAPLVKRTPPTRGAAPVRHAPRKPAAAPVFLLPHPKGTRPETKSSTRARRTAPVKPYVPNRHLLAFARRLDAATHTLNHPEAALARLMARWRRRASDPAAAERAHDKARRLCARVLFRLAPEQFKNRLSADDRKPGPPPDE